MKWNFLLTNSTYAGGLAGLLTTVAGFALQSKGFAVDPALLGFGVTLLSSIVAGFVPDSAKQVLKQVDDEVIAVGKVLPNSPIKKV